jgi:hypothetical protein
VSRSFLYHTGLLLLFVAIIVIRNIMASIDVEDVLSKLTEREKISLLAGRCPLSPSTAFNASLASLTIDSRY